MNIMYKVDLHGYYIHEAWGVFKNTIDDAYYRNIKTVKVVTGQGAIMREFPAWAETHPKIKRFKQDQWNPGSFTCVLNQS